MCDDNDNDQDEDINEDSEPEIPEGEECEICESIATTAFDGLFYCDACFETDIMHN